VFSLNAAQTDHTTSNLNTSAVRSGSNAKRGSTQEHEVHSELVQIETVRRATLILDVLEQILV